MTELPHDHRAEQQIIGAMMTNPRAVPLIVERVEPRDLYDTRHKLIFQAILDLHRDGNPTDPVSVLDLLLRTEGPVVKADYLHTCVENTPTVYNCGYWARIIAGHARRRRIMEIALRGGNRAGNVVNDPVDVGTEMTTEIRDATATADGGMTPLGMTVEETLARMTFGSVGPVYPTGLIDLDRVLAPGLRPGQLVTVAGRPGMGKSIFGSELVRNLSFGDEAVPTLLVSLEMTRQEVAQRLLAAASRVPLTKIRGGLPDDDPGWSQVMAASNLLVDAPAAVADRVFDLDGIVAVCQRFRHRYPEQALIVVDYLQLIKVLGRHDNRVGEVSEISRTLKRVAVESEVPVVAMSQLNRNVEGRVDKRPALFDLRESGSIEQDSDLVILLHRPDYYREDDRPGEIDLIVAKNRHGATGVVTAAAQLDICRFANWTKEPGHQPGSGWD